MSKEIIPFKYNDTEVRTITIDGEPWFVAADLTNILGLTNPSVALSRLDEDERAKFNLGRQGEANIVNEPGLYSLILASRKPEAKSFKRWVTHEVLPAIRKTGTYSTGQPAELTGPELMAAALIEANKTMQEQAARLLEAAPKVEAFEAFLSTNGDYSVGETAKVLARDHQIVTGEKRLFSLLVEWGWLYRDGKKRPLAYQAQIENGRLAMRARQWTDWATGETHPATPQVRVTAKGLEAIAARMKDEKVA